MTETGMENEWQEQGPRWKLPQQLPLADDLLPPVIRELVSVAPENRKIACMIACLAPLGMLSTRVRFWTDQELKKRDAILLQVILEGEPAVGKGFVADVERAIMHDVIDLRDQKLRVAEQEYRERKMSGVTGAELGTAPTQIILQIPPTTSKNEIVRHAGMFHRKLGVPLTMWLFNEELAVMVDASKTGYADLHTVLRVAYDLNSKYGQDFASENSYTGIVNVMICSMFTTTPIDTDNFMTREAVQGGNCSRLIFCPIADPPGARPAKFKRLHEGQTNLINTMVKRMFDNILNENQEAMPEWNMDLCWLADDINDWVETTCTQTEELHKMGDPYFRAYDSFRKRASKNAERCTALFYYLYQLEMGPERANCEEIHERCRSIYRFMTNFILNALMGRWADEYIEYYEKKAKGARVGKRYSLFDQMPSRFTRQQLDRQIAQNGLRTDARFFVCQWKENGWIVETDKFVYEKHNRNSESREL